MEANAQSTSKAQNSEEKSLIKLKEEYQASLEEVQDLLKRILDRIAARFTKKYLPPQENAYEETQFYLPVEFFERKSKQPVPEHKVVITFKIMRNLKKEDILFQIENESVSYPLFECFNLGFFESIIDRVLQDKFRSGKIIHLHTNFESSRIIGLNGELKKLFTIEDDEEIFKNNKNDYYAYEDIDIDFKLPTLDEINDLIRAMWKALVAGQLRPLSEVLAEKEKELRQVDKGKKAKSKEEEDEMKVKEEKIREEIGKVEERRKEELTQLTMSYDTFKTFFAYSGCNMSEENMDKLWKYTVQPEPGLEPTESASYPQFILFAIDLIHCMIAYSIAAYKHLANNCFENKIKRCVEVMNMHFKEYDTEHNNEITFENLKKCLLKENDLFTRKEIEIILRQINPESNFQYWKFDKILRILYYQNFNYQKLMDEDKIYKFLIYIFQKQDPYKTGKLHYEKMTTAFLTQDKITLNRKEILLILNEFNINKDPEIEYFPASLLLRNIVHFLNSNTDISMQKIDISQPMYAEYIDYEDDYDKYMTKIKDIFIEYDKDYDHVINKPEFSAFLLWLVPYADEKLIDSEFELLDQDRDGVLIFKEFKAGFPELMKRTRMRNIVRKIKNIQLRNPKVEEKDEVGEVGEKEGEGKEEVGEKEGKEEKEE